MWKNFFFFSGSQRAGIILLLILILIVLLLRHVWIESSNQKSVFECDTVFVKEFENFKRSLVSIDSIRNAERQNRFNRSRYSPISEVELFPFNPNVIDSADFVRLGLRPWMASNIMKFRRKGGRFRDADGFARVYGLSEEQFANLKAYITIPPEKNVRVAADSINNNEGNAESIQFFVVELNTADTAELIRIKGIGRYIASGIVRYRSQLGGFANTEQLLEVNGITSENFELIKPFCSVDPTLIRKIRINTASVERLRAHPYLNFYQAKQIFELRRRKGKLQGIDELSRLSEIDNSTLEKIKDYLHFD